MDCQSKSRHNNMGETLILIELAGRPLPSGVDVVCYSNGADYVRGMRYAMEQVRNGRVFEHLRNY